MEQQTRNLVEAVPLIRQQIQLLRAQTTQTSTLTTAEKQKIDAQLPQLQRALGELETLARQLSMPQKENDYYIHKESFLGNLSAVIRSLTGLGAITK